jgi:hypothetical protein
MSLGFRQRMAGSAAPLDEALERVHRETGRQVPVETLRDCVEVVTQQMFGRRRRRERIYGAEAIAARQRIRRTLRDEAFTLRGLYPDMSDPGNRLRARHQA